MALSSLHKTYYGVKLLEAFLSNQGNSFEDLFSKIMKKVYKEQFHIVRPYGAQGDLKCDGYLESEKTVFQCYAPRQTDQKSMIAKINKDFPGAVKHWGDKMARWRFVHNDTDGLPPDVVQHIVTLNSENPDITVDHMGFDDVKAHVLKLTLENLEDLFGFAPSDAAFDNLDFEALRPVLESIAKEDPSPLPPIAPPSVQKLDANDFSEDVRELLSTGRRRLGLIRSFFETYPDPDFGEEIAQGFREKYDELKAKECPADEIYVHLQKFAGGLEGSARRQSAVLSILSYFFDSCDIFEDASDGFDVSMSS